jgi:hypothetical protein
MVKTDNDLFNVEDYSAQLAAGCDVVPVYAASKPLKAEDILPMVCANAHDLCNSFLCATANQISRTETR